MVYAVFLISSMVVFYSMYKSGHFVKSLLLSFLQGVCSLFAVNFIGNFLSIHLPLNIFTITVSSIGGTSGVVFLLIYDLISKCL